MVTDAADSEELLTLKTRRVVRSFFGRIHDIQREI